MKNRKNQSVQKQGVYYRKLNRLAILVIIAFSLILFFFTCFLVIQQEQAKLKTNENIALNQIKLLNTSFTISGNYLKTITADSWMEQWVRSPIRGEVYQASTRIYKKLQSLSNNLGSLSYRFVVLSPERNMTISPSDTSSIDTFFSYNTDLSDRDKEALLDHFETSDSLYTSYTYREDGELEHLYFAIRKRWDDGSYVIILEDFDITSLIELAPGEEIAFVSTGTDPKLIEWRDGSMSDADRKLAFRLANAASLNNLQQVGHRCYARQIDGLPWSIVVCFPKNLLTRMLLVCLVLLETGFAALLLIWLVNKEKEKLYSPIREIVDIGKRLETSDAPLDEFEILRNTSLQVKQLSGELRQAIEKQETLARQQYYQNLLSGNEGTDGQDDTPYFVGYLNFGNRVGDHFGVQDLLVGLDLTIEGGLEKQIIPVRRGPDGIALIIKAETQEEARNLVQQFLAHVGENEYLQVALSDKVVGTHNLKRGLDLALTTYDFRHSLPSLRILTKQDLNNLDFHSYRYSIDTEQKLIFLLIEGNDKALALLDEIVAENRTGSNRSRNLTEDLIQALVSTVRRVFQELKTTPEQLLGHRIDWIAFHIPAKDKQERIGEIKHLCREIVDAITASSNEKDRQMLLLMEQYIQHNFSQDIKLQDMADHFNITPGYCGMLFSRLSNSNFKTYLNRYRIEQAKRMLEENPQVKIKELSADVGFNSSNSFIPAFEKLTGTTPKNYATQMRKVSPGDGRPS